jgi:hypothetical protein
MYTKSWLVIKDDTKRTFEVNGPETNTNSFTNKTYAMQRDGMNVSSMTPPVTNKNSSKGSITITGYTTEEGLYNRLVKLHQEITLRKYKEYDQLSED